MCAQHIMAFFLYISTCNQAFAFISVASVLPYHPARVRPGTFLRTVASCASFVHVLRLPQFICMAKLSKLKRLLSVCAHEASRSEVTTFRFTCTYICCVGQLRYDWHRAATSLRNAFLCESIIRRFPFVFCTRSARAFLVLSELITIVQWQNPC